MDGFSAEDLSKIGGIATVSLLHSFIPTHWLPFSIVGRAQRWTLSRTLFVSKSLYLSLNVDLVSFFIIFGGWSSAEFSKHLKWVSLRSVPKEFLDVLFYFILFLSIPLSH